MLEIAISNSTKFFIVDIDDFEKCSCHTWNLVYDYRSIPTTIQTGINYKSIQIGRFILKYSGPLEVDHKDRNIFNNQKENLRIVTHSQNIHNQGIMECNSSGFKGVHWDKRTKKWRSQIYVKKKNLHLGLFEDKFLAAKEYNKAAKKYFGEITFLNNLEVKI